MSNTKVSFAFEITDLPMIMHALSIGSTTAMMCGKPLAKQRLLEYVKQIKPLIPAFSELFGQEEELYAEVFMRLVVCKTWGIQFVDTEYDWATKSTKGHVAICIDDKRTKCNRWNISGRCLDDPLVNEMREFMQQMAHADATEIIYEPVERKW